MFVVQLKHSMFVFQIQVVTFATEHNWDSLDFFDGVDGSAPRLGSYSGISNKFKLSDTNWISNRLRKGAAADTWAWWHLGSF